jgi:hemolysin activation/secretion protein
MIMKVVFRKFAICGSLLALFTGWAGAQSSVAAPDAGSLRQQIEQQRDFKLPQINRQPKITPPPEIKKKDGVIVNPKEFRFVGNKLISSQDLTFALKPFLNKELSFDGLLLAADAVAAAYKDLGVLARAYLPEQDVSDGLITIQVIEARFAGLRTNEYSSDLVGVEVVEAYFNKAQAVGEPLRVDKIDRAILLVDDLPGVSILGTLEPGASEGETTLFIQAKDEPRWVGDLGFDNTGSRSTGSNRLTVNLAMNSAGQRGEILSANTLYTQGSQYGRLYLNVPDGFDGLRLGFSVSTLTYKVIDGPGATVNVKGRSNSKGIDGNYPLIRGRLHNVYWATALDHKSFFTEDMSGVRSDYVSNSLKTGLSGNAFDDLGGGGSNSASFNFTKGKLNYALQNSQLIGIEPQFNKFNLSLSRQQSLIEGQSILFSMQGQHAKQALDSSEKFYLGGAQSVRAYPTSELGGEKGYYVSAEWRWRVNPDWVVTAFRDQGQAIALPATSSDEKTKSTLKGYGVSAAWQGPMGVSTKVTWSHRQGANPKANVNTGFDSDGTLIGNRTWVSVTMPF